MFDRNLTLSASQEHRDIAQLTAEHLFAARTILLFGEITMALAQSVAAQLLALASCGSEPIRVFINSPGGHVESGDTLFDVIRFVKPEVKVLGTGWVASAGALIYAAAKRENRFALPNTRFMLHQPSGGAGGQVSDIEIEAQQMIAVRERLNRIFAEATGQSYEKVTHDTERNLWMNAQGALDYGLVGRIVQTAAELS
jgi:ATP-dependent Clp protease protease subunit